MRTNNCLAIRDLGDFGITFYIGAYLVQIPFITHTINRIKYKPLIDVDSEGTNFYFRAVKTLSSLFKLSVSRNLIFC